MRLQLAVLGGGPKPQGLCEGALGRGDAGEVEPFDGDDKVGSIMKQLVRIEKKEWDKSSSWGDQLPILVSKRSAYVFVLLGMEVDLDTTADSCTATGTGARQRLQPVAYAVVQVNALHAQLQKLFTMPAWRGRGLATRLLGIVLRGVGTLKKGRGYEVRLFVETENVAAIKVYTRCGFREESVVRDYYKVGSDAFRMVLLNTPG